MKLFETDMEYENQFAFIGADSDIILLENRQSPITIEDFVKMPLVVFCPEEYMRDFAKHRPRAQMFRNNKGRLLNIIYRNKVLKNFSALSGYADLNVLNKHFEFGAESQAEIMKKYIQFLRANKLKCNQIAMFSKSGIAECVFYKKTGQLFKYSNTALPQTEKEREAVYQYYKQQLLKKNGMIYGKLQHEKGDFKNVFMIDINNFYGFVLVASQYLLNNPY